MKPISYLVALLLCGAAYSAWAVPLSEKDAEQDTPPSIEINFGALPGAEPSSTEANKSRTTDTSAKTQDKISKKSPAYPQEITNNPGTAAKTSASDHPLATVPPLDADAESIKDVPKLSEDELEMSPTATHTAAVHKQNKIVAGISASITDLLIDDTTQEAPKSPKAVQGLTSKLLTVVAQETPATSPVLTGDKNAPSAQPAADIPATPSLPPARQIVAPLASAKPDLSISFNESATDVPLDSAGQLDALAKSLLADPQARMTIAAYASGPESASIYPKRVALARGIAVRNYLTSIKGIDIERIAVEAKGNKNADGSAATDHVDLFIVK